MLAFASILEGPSPSSIGHIVYDAFSVILAMIDDQAPRVRYTVAFVFYKLAEFVPEIML